MVLANIFQPLIDIFDPVLVFFHGIIGGSWGWSIIALTIVVRALLLPLASKQMHSMQKLQRVAPQMKAIQAEYKDDEQRQQQANEVLQRERDQPVRLVAPAPRSAPGVHRPLLHAAGPRRSSPPPSDLALVRVARRGYGDAAAREPAGA
jgi:hypothetical protein